MNVSVDTTRPTPDGVFPLLEEHHLVVVADESPDRAHFADALASFLAGQRGTAVARFDGRQVTDLESLARAVERDLELEPPVDGTVASLATCFQARGSEKPFQYLIWNDADILLESDVELFGATANTLLAAAAEQEYVSDDRLIIRRIVFVGSDKLAAYADDRGGDLGRWRDDPEVRAMTAGVERPAVLTFRLDG